MRNAARALAVFALVTCVILAGALPAGLAGAAPSGFVTIPDANVTDDVPDHARAELPNASALRGSVLTNSGASTLSVTVSTEARSHGRVLDCRIVGGNGTRPPACDDPELALIFSDDVTHDGRDVAIPYEPIRDSLGYFPQLAYIEHENGSTYTAPIERRGRMLVFHIDRFSSNTVTFSGGVEITGKPSTDGARFSYDINDLDAAGDPNVTLTGSTATEWDNESVTGVGSGSTQSTAPAGNLDLGGPGANGNPTLQVTGHKIEKQSSTEADSQKIIARNDDTGTNRHGEAEIADFPDTIEKLSFNSSGGGANLAALVVDIRLVGGQSPDGTYGEGTKVASWDVPSSAETAGWETVDITDFDASAYSTITVELVVTNGDTNFNSLYLEADTSVGNNPGMDRSYDGTVSTDEGPHVRAISSPSGVGVSSDVVGGAAHDFGDFTDGQSKTAEIDLSTDATELQFNGTGGNIDYTLKMEERTQTVDPSIEVNDGNGANAGGWLNHTGSLGDGVSTTITGNSSWLSSGTNRVNVSVGDGTLSADAPTPQVDLNYTHDAQDDQTVSYDGEKWQERYNVSKTYASDRKNAELTIPFDSDAVISIRDLEKRVNKTGGWSTISSADYSLSGTTLTVQLGDVNNGATIEVRANGSKVSVSSGSITVLSPTVLGGELDATIRFDSWSSSAYIAVEGTENGSEIHYATGETWASPGEYVIFESDGTQKFYLPNAGGTDEATIETIPVEISANGDVNLSVTNASAVEPEFQVKPGPNSLDADVDYTLVNPDTGEDVTLYSQTHDKAIATKEASSPVTITDDDGDELLKFLIESGGGGSTSSTGGGDTVVVGPVAASSSPLDSVPVILIAIVLVILGTAWATRRFISDDDVVVIGVTAGVGLLVLLVTGEAFRPGVILGEIGPAIASVIERTGAVVPAIVLGAAALAGWWIYTKFVKGDEPRDIVVKAVEQQRGE